LLHENHTSAPAPRDTDTQQHVYHKPVKDVNELKQHPIETAMVSNQQSFIDQAIDQ